LYFCMCVIGPLDDDNQPQATKVLMVIGVGIAGHWRLPLCYCLTDGTNADLQNSLLRTVINKLWQSGCCVVSVTMDGLAANCKTFEYLGCSLNPDNIVSVFPHTECSTMAIAAVFDACHMIKLARNCLNAYQILVIPGVGKVKWEHMRQLHAVQTAEGLHLANKLTKSHIEFKTQKMKVRLAVQVISDSCATAIEYLRKSEVPEFSDSFATEVFLRRLDRLFDILNCRSVCAKSYKSPTNANNAAERISFLKETQQFLLSLEDTNGKRLVFTKRRMFVVGLCVTISSVVWLMEQLLLNSGMNGVKLSYLLPYRLSQDNIEIFFSIIRRRGGWCNNPTARQFRSAFRAILSHIGVVPSSSANCAAQPSDDILLDGEQENDIFVDSAVAIQDHDYAALRPKLSTYVENVSSYIAGFVVRKLLPKLKCNECRTLLVDVQNEQTSATSFLRLKNNGGLVVPSTAVTRIVHTAEQYLRVIQCDKPVHAISRLGTSLEIMVLQNIDLKATFGQSNHIEDTIDGIDNHVSGVAREIIRTYLLIRKMHIVKNWNISLKGVTLRQSLTKLVLFKNQ